MAILSALVTGLYYAALALGSFSLLVLVLVFAALTADIVNEFRRLRKARRAVVDDALPRFFRHVPRSEQISDDSIEQWLKDGEQR